MKKLIIADDDEDTAFLVSTALGDSGFLCLRARDGEEALNLARSETPDAMVLDVMMPRMDGIEVCRRLKADVLLSRIPIILLTSLAGIDDRVAGLEAGADDYLPKPFDIRELTARVRALIRANRRERERNPTTNLPAGEAIDDEVHRLLKEARPFTVLYIDIENFRSYADAYGYRRADEVVARLGELILRAGRLVEEPPPFIGHVGGDDFLVIAGPETIAAIKPRLVAAIKEQVPGFYSEEDRARGQLSLCTDGGEPQLVDFMTPSVAEVRADVGRFATAEDLARALTRAKQRVRRHAHSGLIPILDSDDESPIV